MFTFFFHDISCFLIVALKFIYKNSYLTDNIKLLVVSFPKTFLV